jgi:uncharacterized protein YbjT (DUF2867 family)
MTDEAESDAFRTAQERQALEAQMQAALAGVQEAVRRLVHEEAVDPRLILLAMTRVMGEVAELVRQTGLDGLDELRAAVLSPAGNA